MSLAPICKCPFGCGCGNHYSLAAALNKTAYDDLKEKYTRLRTFLQGSIGYFTCSPDGMYALRTLLEETKIHDEVPSTEVQQTNTAGN